MSISVRPTIHLGVGHALAALEDIDGDCRTVRLRSERDKLSHRDSLICRLEDFQPAQGIGCLLQQFGFNRFGRDHYETFILAVTACCEAPTDMADRTCYQHRSGPFNDRDD